MQNEKHHLAGIQVGGVGHGVGIVAVVPLYDDWIQQVCKHLKHTRMQQRDVMGRRMNSTPL